MTAQRKRLILLFAKSFTITLCTIATIVAIPYYFLNNTIQPPEVPNIEVVYTYITNYNYENDETYVYEPPHITHFEERRPSFFTFLIIGINEGYNANTIMVASYDSISREANIISIPRDTIVDFTRNNRKIVASYQVGRLNGGGHKGGIDRVKQEVATIVGFKADFYIRVDYDAFKRMVDAVGGVEIYVPFHKIYDDPYQSLHINIPAGLQILDGVNALHFARYRNGNDPRLTITDYQRIINQQEVITSLVSRLITPSSLLRIPEFINIFNEHVYSNLSMGELLWFANQARGIGDLSYLNLYTIPMIGTSGAPHWFELPYEAGIISIVNETINPLVRDITTSDTRIVIK